jgi:redox-sensing transcriptional repressor
MKTIGVIPKPTKKRLIQLLTLLESYKETKITSLKIQSLTGWKDSLIRHDLWLIGFNNGVSNGYFVSELIKKISLALGFENSPTIKRKCCIVGLGRIGAALLDANFFAKTDFTISAGFDSNVNRVEILRSTFPLYPANQIEFVVKKEQIEFAILATDDKDANTSVQRLINCGIKGIVNMTNVVLAVPKNIKVINLSVVNSLMELSAGTQPVK